MTEYAYDPEFPFLVTLSGHPAAKFTQRWDAEYYVGKWSDSAEIIDTTPKPKIPEDAKHITWGRGNVAYSLYEGLWYGWTDGNGLSEDELLRWIGDAEVVVLVPKEEA